MKITGIIHMSILRSTAWSCFAVMMIGCADSPKTVRAASFPTALGLDPAPSVCVSASVSGSATSLCETSRFLSSSSIEGLREGKSSIISNAVVEWLQEATNLEIPDSYGFILKLYHK